MNLLAESRQRQRRPLYIERLLPVSFFKQNIMLSRAEKLLAWTNRVPLVAKAVVEIDLSCVCGKAGWREDVSLPVISTSQRLPLAPCQGSPSRDWRIAARRRPIGIPVFLVASTAVPGRSIWRNAGTKGFGAENKTIGEFCPHVEVNVTPGLNTNQRASLTGTRGKRDERNQVERPILSADALSSLLLNPYPTPRPIQ